jgi:hypothetical protein
MSIQGQLPAIIPEQDEKSTKIVKALATYKTEAEHNRKSGMNPRDDKWRQNLDLYWNRYDHSNKADWQSKNVMPEVPAFVDRFAAALKEALVSTPTGFYTVTDPYDTENDLTTPIKNMTDVWLSVIGRNQIGQPMDFSTVFEEQMKMGALMAMSGVVLWKDDVPGGRVAFESVDPRFIWLDHTYRNLYRIRRTEVDAVDIARMASATSSKGNPIYNLPELNRLVGSLTQDRRQQEEMTGHGSEVRSDRKPIILDEYIASVVDEHGQLLMDNEVVIVANDEYLIRGPEQNPFWHKKDWMVYTPLMPVPLSPYGRSYMEDFGSIAKVFTDLTNLILDATYMASMNAYALVPSMLKDPTQVNSGIYPNKIFHLEEGYTVEDFAKKIELGSLDAGSIQIWQSIKNELSDAAGMNEIGLGQLPEKTHIAATAVAGAQQSSSAILRSVAQTVETRFLDPLLDLVWKTGLQHASPNDVRMANAVGKDMYTALLSRRRELIRQPITFQARGISGLIQKQQKLQALLGVMQVISQNENLLAAFMQRIDMNKFIDLLFMLSNVDLTKMAPSQREQMIKSVAQPMQEAAAGGQASPAGLKQMGDLATTMGVAQ